MDETAPEDGTAAGHRPARRRKASRGLLVPLLLSGWLCSGCLPLRFTTSPGASGEIVDAGTHSPLSGAEVVISRSTYPPSSPDDAFTNSRFPIVMSREGGQFSVPLERRLDL